MYAEPERRGAQEHDLGEVVGLLAGFGIEHAHARGAALVVVVDDLVDDLVRQQRHVAGALGRGQRGRDAAEISAVRTAADAQVARLAGAALRALVVRERRGEVGAAADDELAAELFVEALLEIDFDAVEIVRREEFAVGQLRQPFDAAADAREDFRLVVPRRDLVVAHGPRNAHALFGIRFEIERTEAITLARPHERAAADVIAAQPVEGLFLDVRVVEVVDEPVRVGGRGIAGAALTGLRRRVSCVMRLPYGRSQGSLVAVGYSPCLTMRPRSSTRVLRPFSVSSLAAQPPLIPSPTTIASNEFVSMLYFNPRVIVSISNCSRSAALWTTCAFFWFRSTRPT